MNVVAFNGSPRKGGNTEQLLNMVFEQLNAEGISTERIDICQYRPRGCTACGGCRKNRDERCVLTDDPLNEWVQKIKQADGVIIGSPTYFANVSSEVKALIDRAGMVGKVNNSLYARKVAAAVVSVRRAGALPAFDAINHMFHINEMIVVGALYWNFAIGREPGEVLMDEEGVATMQSIGRNMAWTIKKLHA